MAQRRYIGIKWKNILGQYIDGGGYTQKKAFGQLTKRKHFKPGLKLN